jgi:class 3 adenylate cyclase
MMRESVTPEFMRVTATAWAEVDVTDLLTRVQAPTLVVHDPQYPMLDVAVAKVLASQIPDARLVLLEGYAEALALGNIEAISVAIDEFLAGSENVASAPEGLSSDIVHTILFTDVEGSTSMTERLGDEKARDLLRQHERITREALTAHSGSEIKTMGDGFMISFSSATKALECAIAMQYAFAEHNESTDEPISVRIGLNAGEPIEEDQDLFGTAVNMAARIAAEAAGGEILASNVVRELVAGKKFTFNDRGETELRGFEDPVPLYEVGWRNE